MDCLVIKGGKPLKGEVKISGAKNAALPLMAATLLTGEECTLRNLPNLSDVRFMSSILKSLGATVETGRGSIKVRAKKIEGFGDYDLIRKMRGSICILGPLMGRLKEAKISMPGGCVIGARPIDLHLKGMRDLGAKISIKSGYVHAKTKDLRGAESFLGGRCGPTVLGTANLMMAATLAKGKTVIHSAACEPEIEDLANFLIAMGAKISGAGSPTITIQGVKKLYGAEHRVIPDRIEAATFALAGAVTNGNVKVQGCVPGHLSAVLDKMREAGVKFSLEKNSIHIKPSKKLKSVDITTMPHAGFPTDVQAQMMVLMLKSPGISIITERIFESRFMHVNELARMGADISIEGPSAIVKGGKPLSGADVMASDLRASAALVLAGLSAQGTTRVNRVYHIDRGYEDIDGKLRSLGANIKREPGH
ncbi:MAG: UDP-N-acetylglucosamine 1-carboxyvinyltransferase [Verrucomicrobiales bacterium]|nr:UDP-N-acetylglucosamine 1-carboxyvinyltransferase [Verrucomicrobiales bacterium]|tara:strand:- start:4069 stop:5331 length:1263 start_codon:yes stop_codon:yes gene_type:complete